MSEKEFFKVAKLSDFAKSPLKKVEVEGREIVLARVGERYYAFQGKCPHRGGPLSKGELADATVTCPWHGGAFDIDTGDLHHPPPVERIRTYPLRVVGGDIEVEVEC
ncbi:MAG: non-heme iron oxygenase ferredoxin subunit [Candidatus Abyssubacteria bacterium]